jgi:hypothetical protein
MKNSMIHRVLIICLGALFTVFYTSCGENDSLEDSTFDVQNYVDQSVDFLHAEGNCGRFGCFEFVFPITIEFPDGESVTVEDYKGLRAELKAWFEENGDNIDWPERGDSTTLADIPFDQLPTFGFPLEVISEDGEVITINNREELHQLRRECRRDYRRYLRRHHRNHHRDHCFKLVFPVSISFPDGNEIEANSPQEMKEAIREWKKNNPEAEERPELVFPLTIEYEDGSTVEVPDKETLKELKDNCSDE